MEKSCQDILRVVFRSMRNGIGSPTDRTSNSHYDNSGMDIRIRAICKRVYDRVNKVLRRSVRPVFCGKPIFGIYRN